ncbi:MAG TPA: penicillin-binding transpeptidase domain-containing protein [Edaphobacter sp.]|nr:penicillin-binding transpeptidase domain-containing protein [Edaphobacter sp.]
MRTSDSITKTGLTPDWGFPGLPSKKTHTLFAGVFLFCSNLPAVAQATPVKIQQALNRATKDTPAVALIVETKTGRLLAVEKSQNAATLRSSPGSILKPFFIRGALEQNLIRPQTTVFCRHSLHILGRNLECTHPQSNVAFTAEEALAYSCNTYFAELANRFSPAQATEILQSYGLTAAPHLFPVEAASTLRAPTNMEQKQLFVLGLTGVAITPAQVAVAYRRLALKLADSQSQPSVQAVEAGMTHSVRYGMAHDAAVTDLQIAGKTGTASDPGQARTHGWFAGIAKHQATEIVIVIYLPHGNGADAARMAHRFLLDWKDQAQ